MFLHFFLQNNNTRAKKILFKNDVGKTILRKFFVIKLELFDEKTGDENFLSLFLLLWFHL